MQRNGWVRAMFRVGIGRLGSQVRCGAGIKGKSQDARFCLQWMVGLRGRGDLGGGP